MPDLSLDGKAQLPDYYSKGGLAALSEGMDMATVRENVGSKATGLTMEMLASLGKDYSKIQLLEDGTVKVTPPIREMKGKKFFEANAYKEKTFMERLGAGLIYNPLETFSKGKNVNLYGSYSLTYQFGFFRH